jgi:hypothetical protein
MGVTIFAAVTASHCHMLHTGKLLCRPLQGRRSAVARLEACSGGGGKCIPEMRLPGPWAALLAQLTAAARMRMRLDAMAAGAGEIGNGDPVLQVRLCHVPCCSCLSGRAYTARSPTYPPEQQPRELPAAQEPVGDMPSLHGGHANPHTLSLCFRTRGAYIGRVAWDG